MRASPCFQAALTFDSRFCSYYFRPNEKVKSQLDKIESQNYFAPKDIYGRFCKLFGRLTVVW